MPYIPEMHREKFDFLGRFDNAGQLNYAITMLIGAYIRDFNGINYQTINDIVGALEGAKQEFYRRIVVPYEDAKIKENGDVY